MTRTRPALALLPLLLLLGARHDPLAGRIAGTPVDCIDLQANDAPAIAGPRTIFYRHSGRRIWKTGPAGDCTPLRAFSRLIVDDLTGGQICAGDRFRVLGLDQVAPAGICRFDRFTPYDKPDRPAR